MDAGREALFRTAVIIYGGLARTPPPSGLTISLLIPYRHNQWRSWKKSSPACGPIRETSALPNCGRFAPIISVRPRQQGTSHCVYKTPWSGDPRVNIQEGKGGKAKDYQVRQVIQAIDKMERISRDD
jgi:hypothetical protein